MQLADPVTGKARTVYLFVACLPFSRYAFVEPALDMKQDTWLRAHVAMFEAFTGSVPRIVPDNLKTGVIKHPSEGEVVLNVAYREMAAHYSAAVLPGRVRAPKDKASVENTVAHVATWIIAGLRQRQFTSLPELRTAIIERMAAYNAEPFQKRPGSRAGARRRCRPQRSRSGLAGPVMTCCSGRYTSVTPMDRSAQRPWQGQWQWQICQAACSSLAHLAAGTE